MKDPELLHPRDGHGTDPQDEQEQFDDEEREEDEE